MTNPVLVALLVLVALGPALLVLILRRRRRDLGFWRAYRALLPGFLLSGALQAGYHATGWRALEVAAPVAMVAGVLLAVRCLER